MTKKGTKKTEGVSKAIRDAWVSKSEIEAKAGSLATINAIADTVYRYLDIKALVEHAVDVILEYIPVNAVALFILDDTATWLDIAAWRGFSEDSIRVGSRLPVNDSMTGATITQKTIVTEYDMVENNRVEPNVKQALLRQGLTGFISVPMLFQGQAVGAINLMFQETHQLTPLERDTLLSVGKTIGLAIVNAQHVSRIETEIHERRRVEEELRHYQEHLEELVASRTAALEQARQKTERISEAKTIFLSNMSHELRTPLNVIIGYTSSMLNMSPIYNNIPLPEIYAADIQLIMDNGYYLLGLINDILDLSKIEAGKLSLHCAEENLNEIFNGVLAISIGLVRDKPLQIRSAIPDNLPLVWADSTRVRQIILNLMSNAIKFTKAGSVTLQCVIEGDFVRISVIDTGIGIPASALPFIFDRFQQAEYDTSKHYGGTGLGLDISKQLAIMHGGQMTVSSVVGEGSIFSFTLPIAENQKSTPEGTKTTPDTIKIFDPDAAEDLPDLPTILLIEREISTRNLIQHTLEDAGYMVIAIENNSQVVGVAQSLSPTLIILGDSSDFSLIDELKAHPETAPIPVAVYTEQWHENLSNKVLKLDKPIQSEQLFTTIAQVCAAK